MKPHRSGLLLLEACVAIALMTIAVVWMLHGFSQTALLVERARDEATALRLLNEQAVYALTQGSVPAAGASGHTADGAWEWSVTTSPPADTTSHLVNTTFTLQWTYRDHPQTLSAATWLPATE